MQENDHECDDCDDKHPCADCLEAALLRGQEIKSPGAFRTSKSYPPGYTIPESSAYST